MAAYFCFPCRKSHKEEDDELNECKLGKESGRNKKEAKGKQIVFGRIAKRIKTEQRFFRLSDTID